MGIEKSNAIEQAIKEGIAGDDRLHLFHHYHRATNADWFFVTVGEKKELSDDTPLVLKIIDTGESCVCIEGQHPGGKQVTNQWAESLELLPGMVRLMLGTKAAKEILARFVTTP